MTYRPVDSKREEFRKYLEKTGVMDALTKVLVLLYEEESKPEDALSYIRKHMCDSAVEQTELEELRTKLKASSSREKQLETEVAQLREKLGEPAPTTADDAEHKEEEKTEDKPADPEHPEEHKDEAAPEGEAPVGEGPAPGAENGSPEPAAE